MKIELSVLAGLVFDEDYLRTVFPYLKPEYFKEHAERVLFEIIHDHVAKYNTSPTKESLAIDAFNRPGYADDVGEALQEIIRDLNHDPATDRVWLVDRTEEFVRDVALFNALTDAMTIYSNEDPKKRDKGAIPGLLSDALAIGFNSSIGHDYVDDTPERIEYYHRKENKIPFHLKYLNLATNDGVVRKTFNVIGAGTGGGKTLAMCDFSAHYLTIGLNVLYVSFEIGRLEIGRRIDANLYNLPIQTIGDTPSLILQGKMDLLKSTRKLGKLIVEEYPSAACHVGHIRHLMNELRLKKNFVPDILIVDYPNLMLSERLKMGNNVGSYQYVKSISEELRGLAVTRDLVVWAPTQLNRQGYANSQPGADHTADSFGLPMTADLMLILSSTEELDELGQVQWHQTTKNRYGDPTKYRSFVTGIDRSRQKLFDLEETAQRGLTRSGNPDSTPRTSNFGTPKLAGKGFRK